MGRLDFICSMENEPLPNATGPCIDPDYGNQCLYCSYLKIREHLDSSDTVVTYKYFGQRGEHCHKTFEPDNERIVQRILTEHPDFLEIC